ncbi:MAG: TetR/AcrR family transcriptional regulator [Deltaproteobacteria bacterium]|jgi:AcrR family transcriptional regulator|nr:TetR/AcrR family transcriptional regulator [Deltaproteobacteria bacterium]
MENKKSRPYTSTIRKQQALETRNRIADAAEGLIKGAGYENATINTIAATAGVATQTVYSVFGSKAGILVYLLTRKISAHISNEDAHSLESVAEDKSAAETLAGVARLRNAHQQGAIDSLGGFSAIYPELNELVVTGDKIRRRMTTEYLENLPSEEGDLFNPADATAARRLDLVMALTDTTLHHYLSDMVSDWDDDLYEKVLVQLLNFVMRDMKFA